MKPGNLDAFTSKVAVARYLIRQPKWVWLNFWRSKWGRRPKYLGGVQYKGAGQVSRCNMLL